MKAKDHKIWPLPGLERSNKMASFLFQSIKEIKEALRPQAACDTAVLMEPGFLWIVLDEYKAEGMCSSAVRKKPYTLMYVFDHFKTQEMCDRAVKGGSFFCSLSLIGLLQKSGEICGMMNIMMMMVIIGMIKINFLSGMMGIKNAKPKKHKLRKS